MLVLMLDEASAVREGEACVVAGVNARFEQRALVRVREGKAALVERGAGAALARVGEDGDERECGERMLRVDCAHRRPDVLAVDRRKELDRRVRGLIPR